MVKIYSTQHTHPYPLPAVSLAYYLRYPNPLSTHVLSTDTISRTFDPVTQRLHIVRLHLKRSKLPTTLLKILPSGFLSGGAGESGAGGTPGLEGKSYVLEASTVDVREGWMETESRNLEWTGVLSVVERARYTRPQQQPEETQDADSQQVISASVEQKHQQERAATTRTALPDMAFDPYTQVSTVVTFQSRFGAAIKERTSAALLSSSSSTSSSSEPSQSSPPPVKQPGFLASWTSASIQRTIEGLGVKRTRTALVKSRDGMNLVLERLRLGGLKEVLEGMRRDRELVIAGGGTSEGRGGRGGGGGGGGIAVGDGQGQTEERKGAWQAIWRRGCEGEASLE
ncbi:hypothetical protein MMC25_001316 [Agyrium rufum]|nr:hypothetical protein [Agyrium rufum]